MRVAATATLFKLGTTMQGTDKPKPTKRRARSFRVNENVVYPSHGVGKIISIENQEIAGMTIEMFIIHVEPDNLTLSIPVKKCKEIGMRRLSTKEEIDNVMKILKGKAMPKKLMWSRRAQEYDQKINSGDIVQLAEVVRDLHRNDEQKEQSYSERQLFEKAIERLGREIAAVTGVSREEAGEKMQRVLTSRRR